MNALRLSQALQSGIGPPLLAGCVALAATLLLVPGVIWIAHRYGWVAAPRGDRWHRKPTALLGGLGIFAGWACALIATGTWPSAWIAGGAALLLVAGLVDDLKELKPLQKLILQVVAALFPLFAGLAFADRLIPVVSVPLTLLWIVGVTNALNLIDGMDGLAGGLAAITAGVLGVSALIVGDVEAAVTAFALTGACAGFLVFNFQPARIFMGDGGSLFLGYMLATLALRVQQLGEAATDRVILLALPVAVLAVPIFDTTLVTFMRTLHGRRVTQGGNDHLMHRLVHLGLSQRRTVLLLYGVTLIYGAIALSLLLIPPALAASVGGLVAMLTLAVGFNVASADVYETRDRFLDSEERSALVRWGALLQRLLGREWKAMFGLVVDLALMAAVSVIVSNIYRYAGEPVAAGDGIALAAIYGVKLLVFYGGGLYRGIWRYAGTPEMLRIVTVGATATFASALFAAFVSDVAWIPVRVLITDAALTAAALMSVRLGLRAGRQMISAGRESGQRTLLYGAGDGGLIVLREIRQNADYGYRPIGFLDDDPFKHGMRVQGLPVGGGLNSLDAACRRLQVEVVLITARRMTQARRQAIVEACVAAGVDCHALTVRLERLYTTPAAIKRAPSSN